MTKVKGTTRQEWITNTLDRVRRSVHKNLAAMKMSPTYYLREIEEEVMKSMEEVVERLSDDDLRAGERITSLIYDASNLTMEQICLDDWW